MPHQPFLFPDHALQRFLASFATMFGVDEKFAMLCASEFVDCSPVPHLWTRFVLDNCSECPHDPDSCAFFHPDPARARGGLGPEVVQAANHRNVEKDTIRSCPIFAQIQG